MFNKYPDVLTVKQLAEALGIGVNKAYELVNNHVIGSKRIGKKILVPKVCLIDFVESSKYSIVL
ncbi:MAG: helix-turn-helix domain-containing protein [Oscillospiraceae bacterium]